MESLDLRVLGDALAWKPAGQGVTLVTALDFEVLVCDPREEYAAVLEMAGVPKLDDMALLEALTSDAFYAGALGSHRNQQARMQRLTEHLGLTESQLARLHGPVGLKIGARTPAEIAVSILAEIIQIKNTVTTPAVAHAVSSCAS